MVKLLIIQPAAWDPVRMPGSLENLMTQLCEGLALRGHDVTLAAADEEASWVNTGEHFRRQVFHVDSVRQCIANSASAFEVVSVHNRVDLVTDLPAGTPLSLVLHGPAVHGIWPGRLPSHPTPTDVEWSKSVEVVQRATRLAAPSRWALRFNLDLFGVHDGDVVYPFVDPIFANLPRSDTPLPAAIYVGRPIQRKGLPWLHEHSARWSFPWLWAGDPLFGDAALRESLPASTDPVATPRTRHDMAALLARAPVVLCPYDHEGFGMVLAEAAAAGSRVVSFSHCGLTESGVASTTTLVEPWDVDAFDRATVEALRAGPVSPDERSFVARVYTIARSVDAYEAHLLRTYQSCP